jgi:RHS repeat-associated protein
MTRTRDQVSMREAGDTNRAKAPARWQSLRFFFMILGMLALSAGAALVSRAQGLTNGDDRAPTAPETDVQGFIETADGSLHMEIPLGSFPQRGSDNPPIVYRLVYDSDIWDILSTGSNVWEASGTGQTGGMSGWRLVPNPNETIHFNLDFAYFVNMNWTDAEGTQRYFPLKISEFGEGTGNAFATDSSGYHMYWNNNSNVIVYAPDGSIVVSGGPTFNLSNQVGTVLNINPNTKDSNGNYLFWTGPGTIMGFQDSLGRQDVQQYQNCPGSPTSSTVCYTVPSSSGGFSTYMALWTTIAVKTHFQQSSVTECVHNCTTNVIQSIILPDGTSYQFQYDCDPTVSGQSAVCASPAGQNAYYGTLLNVTLPTGGQTTYGYTMFTDSYGNKSQWLNQRTSAGGTWTYSPQVLSNCSSTQVGCQYQVTTGKPSGDSTITTFTLNNGPWPTEIQSYDSGGNLLTTINSTYDFSNACPLWNCHGASYVRILSTTDTVANANGVYLTKQTTYAYDSPNTGNVISKKEWKYYPGTSNFPSTPDRTTTTTYLTTAPYIINRPTSITVQDNAGNTVSQTQYTYDSYGGSCPGGGLSSVVGAANHDDTNYGTGNTVRGNPTQIQRTVNGSSYLTTQLCYDTTGQITAVIDPKGNVTQYGYTDNFYSDGSMSPPATYQPSQPTNAYLTSLTVPLIGTATAGYYFGTGQQAISTDQNSATSYAHYIDPFNRLTETILPINWGLLTYPSATESDAYIGVGDTSPSTGCSSCAHNAYLSDEWGRTISERVVNNPGGTISTDTNYDSNGRVQSVSHPYIGTSTGNETYTYDGIDRTTQVTHPDNENVQTLYGPNVSLAGGLTTQQGSPTTYGYGYPAVVTDETGKRQEEWLDGFGRIIEVDEATQTGTPGEGTVTIYGSEQSGYTCNDDNYTVDPNSQCTDGSNPYQIFDSGTVSLTVNGSTVFVNYGSNDTLTTVVASLAGAVNAGGLPVTATPLGNTIILDATTAGSATNYTVSSSSTWDSHFTSPSFSAGGTTLTGGSSSGINFSSPVTTFYTYDAAGRLTLVVQGPQRRSFAYDGLGRLTQETTPEANTEALSYTAGGGLCSGDASNPCSKVDGRGITTTFTYDALNRLTGKSFSNGQGNVSYTYDQGGAGAFALGRLTQMTDPSGSETYTYNSMGWITQLQKNISGTTYTMGYQYNTEGDLTTIIYPSGRVVQHSYNQLGQLCEVAPTTSACGNSSTPYATGYIYNAAGQLTGFNYGNGVAASLGYSASRSQLSSLSYAKSGNTLFSLNYFYQQDPNNCPSGASGNNGQIQCIVDNVQSGRTVSYTYDPVRRLLTATTQGSTNYPQWGLAETYDRFGNRWSEAVTAGAGPSVSMSFGASGMNSATTNQPNGFGYDGSGNMTYEPPNNYYSYDDENRLITFSGGSGSATYSYDGNDLRVEKTVNGTNTTVSIFSGSEVIAEYAPGSPLSNPLREYIYGGGQMLAKIENGATEYYHQDHLSVRLMTDANGNKIGEQGHFPFGEGWYNANTTTNWMFTSYDRDSESGLDYALARYYDSRVAMFCSADPVEGSPADPESWNRYTYVEDDPINLTDPTGRGFFSWLLNIFMIILDILTMGASAPGHLLVAANTATQMATFVKDIQIIVPAFHAADHADQSQSQQQQNQFQVAQRGVKSIYCDQLVQSLMRKAWDIQQTNNTKKASDGTSGIPKEAGFPVKQSPDGSTTAAGPVTEGDATGWNISNTIPGGYTGATFHTHPDDGDPSTESNHEGEKGSDAQSSVNAKQDVYVISNGGLAVTQPSDGPDPKWGKDNSPWIIQGKNIDDWMKKLKDLCAGTE